MSAAGLVAIELVLDRVQEQDVEHDCRQERHEACRYAASGSVP